MKKNFENNAKVKEDIKKVNPDVLVNRGYAKAANKSGIVCPHCGNGTHDEGTGITFKQDANGFYRGHCFRCGENFDNLRIIADHFGYDLRQDFPKILAEGATLLGASADFGDFKFNHKSSAKNFKQKQEQKKDSPLADYKKFLESAFLNLEDLPEKSRRGLELSTLINFNCGFAKDWKHPNSPKMPTSDRIIVPTSNHHYLARAISDDVKSEFRKIHVGKKEIFNIDALKEYSTILVVEGEFDAMSIWQATDGLVPVVAVSGCSNYKLIFNWLEENPDCHCSFIVMFDNDSKEGNAGQMNAEKFVGELNHRGFSAVNKILSERQDFDANDWIQENSDALRDRIFDIYDESATELQFIADKIEEEKDFQADVSDFVNANGEIPTGFIDEIKIAIDKLSSYDVDNFDARLISDETFRRQLGLCNFYNFATSALDNIMSVFVVKRKLTLQKIKLGVELKESEKPFLNLSESDIKKIIKKATKSVESQHENFNKEQEKKRREEYRQQKYAEEQQAKADGVERLFQLQKMSPSTERNNEIRDIINQICEWQVDRYGVPQFIKPDINNFDLIFRFDPVIEGLFGYDSFNREIVFTKEPFWRMKESPDFIGDSENKKYADSDSYIGEPVQTEDKHALANYISRTYGKINAYRQFERHFSDFALAHSFHPVKEFLAKLPKWDGVPRAERIFIDFLNADDTPYTREITFKSLLAAIVRVYKPGAEWQAMPILRGAQGIGKSHVLKMLGGDWHTELFANVSDSHAMDAIEGALIVELPELDAFQGSRANTIKSFISRNDDKRRKAYAIAKSSNKRTCVFFGTSNDSQVLTDLTGNRRFPIIKCNSAYNQVKYGLSQDYIHQLWAELHLKYQKMKAEDGGSFDVSRLRFSSETLQKIEELAKDFISDDGLIGEICAFLETSIPHKPVWNLLSREERKKFYSNGGFIVLNEQDLLCRQASRRRPEEMKQLQDVLALAESDEYSVVRNFDDGNLLTFYGAVLRDTICASEVYNECFSNFDRRISVFKIAEILASNLPDDWHRERRKTTVYGDQPNTFVREVLSDEDVQQPSEPADNVEETPSNNGEETPQESSETESVDNNFEIYDDVTISSAYYADEEEFLTDDELRQFQDNDF